MDQQRIVCAAVRDPSNGLIICGARHMDFLMIDVLIRLGYSADKSPVDWEEGFVDNKGNFLDRQEAHKVATATGQIIQRCGGDARHLFSEILY